MVVFKEAGETPCCVACAPDVALKLMCLRKIRKKNRSRRTRLTVLVILAHADRRWTTLAFPLVVDVWTTDGVSRWAESSWHQPLVCEYPLGSLQGWFHGQHYLQLLVCFETDGKLHIWACGRYRRWAMIGVWVEHMTQPTSKMTVRLNFSRTHNFFPSKLDHMWQNGHRDLFSNIFWIDSQSFLVFLRPSFQVIPAG